MTDSAILEWIAWATAWTAVVFVAVRVADGALRRVLAPRWRLALYTLVLVRLVLPADWQSPAGVLAATSTTAEVATAQAPVTAEAMAAAEALLISPDIAVPHLSSAAPAAALSAPAAGLPQVGLAARAWGPLAVVYGFGVLFLLGIHFRRVRTLHRWRRESIPADPRFTARAGGIPVKVHPHVGPFAMGIVAPTIVIPQSLLFEQRETVQAVLDHEAAHLSTRDPAALTVVTLVAIAAWPVAPVWLAAHRVRQLLEQSADARALRGADRPQRRRYAEALVRLCDRAVPTPHWALGAFGELAARVRGVMRPQRTPVWVQAATASAVATAVMACAAVQGEAESESPMTCDALVEEATVAHDRAEKQGDANARGQALAAYDRYADQCQDHPDYGAIVYFRAEARWAVASELYGSGDTEAAKAAFLEAREAFELALDHPSDYEHDAAYAQFLSLVNGLAWELPNSDGASPVEPCKDDCNGTGQFPLEPYSAEDARVVRAWQTLLTHMPRPVGKAEELRMAKLFAQHNDFGPARAEAESLVQHHDGSVEAVHGAEILLDVLTIDWVEPGISPQEADARGSELDRWAETIENAKLYALPEAEQLRDAVPRLRSGVEWKRGIADLAAGREGDPAGYVRCADRFDRLAERYPDHARVDAIRSNAEQCRALAGESAP